MRLLERCRERRRRARGSHEQQRWRSKRRVVAITEPELPTIRADRHHRARASRALDGGARNTAPVDARGRARTTDLPILLGQILNAWRSAGSRSISSADSLLSAGIGGKTVTRWLYRRICEISAKLIDASNSSATVWGWRGGASYGINSRAFRPTRRSSTSTNSCAVRERESAAGTWGAPRKGRVRASAISGDWRCERAGLRT